MSKPKIAFFDFTSCEGCQLTVVDSLQMHVDLLDAVEIVQFREAISERGDVDVHVTVDKPDENWKGNVGVITTLFPKVPVYARNTVAITCGPPVMYRFVLMELMGKGIPEGNIYLSLERRMKCGVGKCGHCQINNVYCCQSGPVFSYADIKALSLSEALT